MVVFIEPPVTHRLKGTGIKPCLTTVGRDDSLQRSHLIGTVGTGEVNRHILVARGGELNLVVGIVLCGIGVVSDVVGLAVFNTHHLIIIASAKLPVASLRPCCQTVVVRIAHLGIWSNLWSSTYCKPCGCYILRILKVPVGQCDGSSLG